MKYLVVVLIMILSILFAGCVQSDPLPPVDNLINTTTTPDPSLAFSKVTFSPLVTSDAYVAPQTIVPIVTPSSGTTDPIVGSWKYSGQSYQCDATFSPDGNGQASCSSGYIPLGSRTFKWVPSTSPYTWMRNYILTEINSDKEYVLLYSERNNGITSDIIPDGGYLVKVS